MLKGFRLYSHLQPSNKEDQLVSRDQVFFALFFGRRRLIKNNPKTVDSRQQYTRKCLIFKEKGVSENGPNALLIYGTVLFFSQMSHKVLHVTSEKDLLLGWQSFLFLVFENGVMLRVRLCSWVDTNVLLESKRAIPLKCLWRFQMSLATKPCWYFSQICHYTARHWCSY